MHVDNCEDAVANLQFDHVCSFHELSSCVDYLRMWSIILACSKGCIA